MPDKRAAELGPSSGASTGGNPRRFLFDWFSDSEDHLMSVLAEADAASVAMGGNFPSLLPSPLLGPQAYLPGPDRSLFNQVLAPVDPESLNFESDEDDLGEGSAHDVAQPPPSPTHLELQGLASGTPMSNRCQSTPSIHRMSPLRRTSSLCHVSSPRERATSPIIMCLLCVTPLSTSPPGLAMTTPLLCLPPPLGRRPALFS
jgi:hypothetical protein